MMFVVCYLGFLRRSGSLVIFHFLKKVFFSVFDEVAPPAAPGHISGPRSGGSGLHLHFQSECRFGKYPLTKKIHGSPLDFGTEN